MVRALGTRFYRFWWVSGLADDVPALTYYLVLSLAPFALGLAAIEALLLEDYVSALEVAETINRYLPEAIHQDITNLITGTRSNSPYLLAVAVGAMLWTSSGAIGVVERCISRILDLPRHNIVWGRIRNMILGLAVAGMVIVAAASATVITGVTNVLGVGGEIPSGLLFAMNAAGSALVFGAVYRLAPLAHLHWRCALVGALPAGISLQLVPFFVSLYVRAAAGYEATRLFLVIGIILGGLYLMATILLVGAGIASRQELRLQKRLASRPPRTSRRASRRAARDKEAPAPAVATADPPAAATAQSAPVKVPPVVPRVRETTELPAVKPPAG